MTNPKHNDFVDALKNNEIWIYFAWQDIKLRYRRSKLGPFWITLSMAIFCMMLGFIFSRLFKMDMEEYLPFLTTGFILWGLISSVLIESPNLFVDNSEHLKNTKLNLLVVVLRMISRNFLIFLHNVVVIVCVCFYFKINPGFTILYLIPGLILVLLNLIAMSVILSLIGARYRDLTPMTQSFVQIIFFVTPLTWLPKLVSDGSWIIKINPFAYFLDLTRSPMLGIIPQKESWFIAIIFFLILSFLARKLYNLKSKKITFWL